ncbi:unnamed protein product [Clavelina lepadiformis]|uniref:Uncharacterized protein n=1 Tax=Clavelina lepadiformis TaxID=159417 RepID=A0ABP0G7Y7_CLALP
MAHSGQYLHKNQGLQETPETFDLCQGQKPPSCDGTWINPTKLFENFMLGKGSKDLCQAVIDLQRGNCHCEQQQEEMRSADSFE